MLQVSPSAAQGATPDFNIFGAGAKGEQPTSAQFGGALMTSGYTTAASDFDDDPI